MLNKKSQVKFWGETYSILKVLHFKVVVLNSGCTTESLAETFKAMDVRAQEPNPNLKNQKESLGKGPTLP